MKNLNLFELYHHLLKKHGYQGWWPIKGKYTPRDYTFPHNREEEFEIMAGAVLTQNTSWKNAEKALNVLHEKNILSPQKICAISHEELSSLIKSSGYHNQKAKKLRALSEFYLKNIGKIYSREQLLEIWGIGKETADSILLYAYKQPYFVIDSYTKKLVKKFFNLEFKDYDELQEFFHRSLPKDYKLFNEFHALLVAEGKTFNQ